MGTMFIVSTPIGNLKDITQRAKETLEQVDLIACEDTRKTGQLLKNLEINAKGKLISYYEENEARRIPELIQFLKSGQSVALVSNAGTPTIADPGFKLTRECLREGIKVEAVPGPSAVITALVSSGLPTDKFLFLGFLPKKQGKRLKALKDLKEAKIVLKTTTIIFLSPHRLLKELKDTREIFGEIEITLCRELTKVHEEIRREAIDQVITRFEGNKPRGEFVLLFN